MNAVDDSGKEPGTQPKPVAEAGCEGEVDRSVPGTVVATGFAQVCASLIALSTATTKLGIAFKQWCDAQEPDAKDASTRK